MAWKEFRFVRDGKAALVWKIEQNGDTYRTQHGQLDGAMQEYSDTPGSKGLTDSAAFITPIYNCTFHVSREIRKKTENGYIEYENGKPLTEQIDGIDFDKPLPKCFCSYKPQTSITDVALAKLHKDKRDRYSRKYDGCCHVLVHHTYGWEVYTRRMDETTSRFPKLIGQLNELKQFGKGTIIVGELMCLKPDGTDDFKAISRFCRSIPEESRRLVKHGDIHEPIFVMFDTLFHNGRDLKNKTYDDRSKLLKTLPPLQSVIDYEIATADKPFYKNEFRIVSVDYYDLTPDTWEAFAKEAGWEGFVVTDGLAKSGNKFYSFSGKAKRPKGCHKLKPEFTEDCVVFAASQGTGKRLGRVGALWIKQIDPNTGKFVSYGKVGSGFTDEDIDFFSEKVKELDVPFIKNEREASKIDMENNYDLVIEIKYSERQEDTNKFRFPVFLRLRTDKGPKECVANI
ncbi:hypothetical protein LCGC14_0547160 [marine sediment metagenome]|uniref:ATP-dependent DNA ligase family profile domain-containing protein n=1 Tax=marine sediment metagenome TaxID=412755 RepID=A0A0F9RVR0_9ZZZZ